MLEINEGMGAEPGKQMTVSLLKEILNHLPDEALVILSTDEEGNGFHVLYDVCAMHMDKARYGYEVNEDATDINAAVLWPA